MPRKRRIQLGLHGLRVAAGEHVAYLWRTEADFRAAVDVLEWGFRRRDFGILFGYPVANARICAELARRGLAWRTLVDGGRLTLVNTRRRGPGTLSRLARALRAAADRGAPLIRVVGNIGWGHPGWPPVEDLLAYEARLAETAGPFPTVVTCMYQLSRGTGAVVLWTAFGSHSLTIFGDVARWNPYYVPLATAAQNPGRARTGALPSGARPRARSLVGSPRTAYHAATSRQRHDS